jgi:HEAT repeat protein
MIPRLRGLALLAAATASACGGSDAPKEPEGGAAPPPKQAEPEAPSAGGGLDLTALRGAGEPAAAPDPGPAPPDPAPATAPAAPDPAPVAPKPDEGPPKPPPPGSPDEITDAEVLATWNQEERDALHEMPPGEKEKEIRKRRLEIFKERGGVLDASTDAEGQKKLDEATGERGPARPDAVRIEDLPPPALQDILSDLASRDPEIRARGADSAQRFPDKAVATKHMLPLLQDKDQDLRQIAAATLGALGQEEAIAPLLVLLLEKGDRDPVRAAAVKALSDIPGAASSAGLRRVVRESSEPADCAAALAMLVKRKEPAEVKDLLPEALKHLSAEVRGVAVAAVREFKLKEREADLAPMLEDVSDNVIIEVIRTYAALGTRSAVGPLVRLLIKPHEESENPEAIQDAVNEALRVLTNQDMGYDSSNPDEAKRAEAIDSWRLWWEKNKGTWK